MLSDYIIVVFMGIVCHYSNIIDIFVDFNLSSDIPIRSPSKCNLLDMLCVHTAPKHGLRRNYAPIYTHIVRLVAGHALTFRTGTGYQRGLEATVRWEQRRPRLEDRFQVS